jgi:hypothetical protein
MDGIKTVQSLLRKIIQKCHCETLDQCGKGIFRSGCLSAPAKSLPANQRRGGLRPGN